MGYTRTFTLHVRVAKHYRFRDAQRIEASQTPNQRPLTVGGREVHTAFFKLKVRVPDELLEPSSVPQFTVELGPADATTVTPEIEVAPLDETA